MAALPWRQGTAGIEILLVTTRSTGRWVIPKGWPMPGKADHNAAAQEAFEEAGVQGRVDATVYGHYGYEKVSDKGRSRPVDVAVYALRVETELQDWPERHERQRRWVSPSEAATLSGEAELTPLLQAFAESWPRIQAATPTEEKTPWQWLIGLFR